MVVKALERERALEVRQQGGEFVLFLGDSECKQETEHGESEKVEELLLGKIFFGFHLAVSREGRRDMAHALSEEEKERLLEQGQVHSVS